MKTNPQDDLLQLTADIVSAHATRNQATAGELSDLIRSVFTALGQLGDTEPAAEAAPPPSRPAVPINKSVFPDYLVCLEDGKKLKMLKRHLFTAYGMTPDEYREKWGLPKTYPMAAPNYAKTRSTLAKAIGLGRKPQAEASTEPTEPAEPAVQRIPEGASSRRGARKKAA